MSWPQVVFTDSLAQNLPVFSFCLNRIKSKSQVPSPAFPLIIAPVVFTLSVSSIFIKPCTASPVFYSESRRCLTSKPAPAHHQVTHYTTPRHRTRLPCFGLWSSRKPLGQRPPFHICLRSARACRRAGRSNEHSRTAGAREKTIASSSRRSN